MSYEGFYINLDRSAERREKMETEIVRHGLTEIYRRWPATEGNKFDFPNPTLTEGEIGCFTSNYLLFKETLDNPKPLHVAEDDILFAGCLKAAIDDVIRHGLLNTYDIIYTETGIAVTSGYFNYYKTLFDKITVRDGTGRISQATFQVIDLSDRFFAGHTSFIVGPRSIRKLHDLFAAALVGGTTEPIDIFIGNQAKKNNLKIGCLFPFVTSIRLESSFASTIEGRYDQLPILASNIARNSFFIDQDLAACRNCITQFLPWRDDEHSNILSHILGFYLGGKHSA